MKMMMKIDTGFKAVFVSMMIMLGSAAYSEEGPAETAGKKIDQTTETVFTAISDTEITTKIKAALLDEPGLKSMKISVDTTEGTATLYGLIDSQLNKDKVTKLTESVKGVKSVRNELVISN
jgi:hyperosmotically inducible protein